MFGHTILSKGTDPECSINVAKDGSDSVQDLKEKISEAFGGTITRDQLLLHFGPNERAAAMSEGKDPDQAVQEARTKGEIPTLTELPAPWGPKPYVASAADAAHGPARYPDGFSPLDDAVKPVLAI
ncbi:hypothetical protein WJX75_007299 [Coccomyxa subellipsoidea]|uniref:Ubiquitin-like domain-containing protein n=1 Tax=Coccomyxa subellipsoidea TaxID=248742 RepID=A0ABR2YY81_9CHLO